MAYISMPLSLLPGPTSACPIQFVAPFKFLSRSINKIRSCSANPTPAMTTQTSNGERNRRIATMKQLVSSHRIASASACSDLDGQSSSCSPWGFAGKNLGSMNMEVLFHSICDGGGGGEGGSLPRWMGERTVEEAWRKFAADGKAEESDAVITLEDFPAKASVVLEPRISSGCSQVALGPGQMMGDRFGQPQQLPVENPVLRFGNGDQGVGMIGGRGKRPFLDPVDRAVAQRQKRMIKNRESAARSRERKQAYVAELESLVARLEEDKVRLEKCLEMEQKMKMKQAANTAKEFLEKYTVSSELKGKLMRLLETIKLEENRPGLLRRANSMEW